MRNIKFRGKTLVTGEWVYGSLLTNGEATFIVETFGEDVTFGNGILMQDLTWHRVDETTVGQYTGKTDRNGCEIYENDIAKREFSIGHTTYHPVTLGAEDYVIDDEGYFIGVVNFTASNGLVLNKSRKYSMEGEFIKKCSGIKLHPQFAEIIGNIHDNPNLLNQEETV